MPSDNKTKSAKELAEATGAERTTVAKEYEAAAELAGLEEEPEE